MGKVIIPIGFWDNKFPPLLKARLSFTDTSFVVNSEVRKIPFSGTQGNYSDNAGNLLASSNGQWIANATGDTMLNGADLNPNSYTTSYPAGLVLPNANLIVEKPGDSTKLIIDSHDRK